jgi:hypothetical protein
VVKATHSRLLQQLLEEAHPVMNDVLCRAKRLEVDHLLECQSTPFKDSDGLFVGRINQTENTREVEHLETVLD